MKKIVKIFLIVLLIVLVSGNLTVDAKTIKIHDHTGGPQGGGGGVNTLTLFDKEYYINVDDSTNIGYLVLVRNGNEYVLGTCEVIVIDNDNPNGMQFCIDNDENSCGQMVIIAINNEEGYISSLSGDLNNYFAINNIVKLNY